MALIQKIRSMSALVLILMFTAIISFIGMLIMQDANPGGGKVSLFGSGTMVAKVAGESFDMKDMDRIAAIKYGERGGADMQVRNALYGFFVENTIITKEAEASGLGVSKPELLDLEFGDNISPAIMQNQGLADPNTGRVDIRQLQQIQESIKNNKLPAQGKIYWAEIEKEVIKDRLQTKLTNLVTKAIYTPTWAVEEAYKDQTEPADIEYVKIGFDKVEDKDITVTDSDFEAYLAENKARYTNDEESRIADYVAFNVVPTMTDSNRLRDKMLLLKTQFTETKKDSLFAVTNGGMMSEQYATKESLPATIKDELFNAPLGLVVGPYVDGKAFVLAKMIDRRSAPDSVRSRHILLKGATAQAIADSLKGILDVNPTKWDSLNQQYSTDEGAKMKNGDLDYQAHGTFVPTVNDLIFYKAQPGKYYTVASQFGVHLMQVTGVKAGKNETRGKIAYIRQGIIPSSETDKAARFQADDLVASSKTLEELKKNAAAKNLAIVSSPNFKANDMQLGTFGGATGVRQLIRWAFDTKGGETSKEVFAIQQQGEPYVSQYLVSGLKSIEPKGLATLANIKEKIMPLVRNRKKGEFLKNKIGNVTDLNALAATYGKVDTAKGLVFNANFIPNIGQEPKVLGAAFTTAVNSISAPIVGENALFVVKVVKKEALASSPVDKNVLRQQLTAPTKQAIRGILMKSLKKEYSVTDNRAKFF